MVRWGHSVPVKFDPVYAQGPRTTKKDPVIDLRGSVVHTWNRPGKKRRTTQSTVDIFKARFAQQAHGIQKIVQISAKNER